MNNIFNNTYLNTLWFLVINSVNVYVIDPYFPYLSTILAIVLNVGLMYLIAKQTSKTSTTKKEIFNELVLIGCAGAALFAVMRYVVLEINPAEIERVLALLKSEMTKKEVDPEVIASTLAQSKKIMPPFIGAITILISYGISAPINAFISSKLFSAKKSNAQS